MTKKEIKPPRFAQRFLSWYCRPNLLEDLQGDLNEYFERNVKTKGAGRARLIYVLDVLKFLRPYTVRKPEIVNILIHWIMIGSYIKTSARSIVRHKMFSFINIAGLAVSMSVGLVVIAFISDLFSYDQFHEKKDRIYRVTTTNQAMNLASTSVLIGKKIRENVAGVEDLTLIRRGFGGDVLADGKSLSIGGLWADESFLKVFTFPLLYGDPATALKEPYSLVLTEKTAKRLFGTTDAIGKSVVYDTVDYLVTGVMRDIPKHSHLQFDALASFSTVEILKPDTDGGFLSWGSIYMNFVYLVLPPDSGTRDLQAGLNAISVAENKHIPNSDITFSLQPLTDIVIGKSLVNQIGPSVNRIALWVLSALASIIILSACFNYTNLSIARSLRRSREVGIRKVMGAFRSHVMGQFITESVIIALLALTFSFILFLLLRPQFLSLHSYLNNLTSLELSPRIVLCFVALALVVGVLAGIAPAFFFSRINAIRVLKDTSSLQLFRHVSIRKALIVVQYVFSLVFITTTTIGYRQYRSFITFDLGFSTHNIVNINLQGNKGDLLKKELSSLKEVDGIAQSMIVMSLGNIYGSQMKYKKMDDSSSVWSNYIDEHYLPLHGHRILAGRNFFPGNEHTEEHEAIVNEKTLPLLGIEPGEPTKAVGEEIVVNGKKLTIVGVVKDFHYETVEDPIEPVVLRYFTNPSYGYLNVKVTSNNWPATFASLESVWQKVDRVHPLDARFYDDQIAEAYSAFSMMIKVIGFLAFLAVCISSLGLFGMVVFTTETRIREISIRKVMGASEQGLVYLLSSGFLTLLAIATLIALPATYLFFEKVILAGFAYRQPIGLGELFAGALTVTIIAFVMIGSQTLRVARSNPANVLRNE